LDQAFHRLPLTEKSAAILYTHFKFLFEKMTMNASLDLNSKMATLPNQAPLTMTRFVSPVH
jgi:hypothetical protein